MNFNVNTKTAACDLSRHREAGGSHSEVQFIPTSEPHQLESGLQKNRGLLVRVAKAHAGSWTPTIIQTHQRLLTVQSQNIDDSQNSSLNFACKFMAVCFIILTPLRGHVKRSSVLNTPAGIYSVGWLWLLSGFYSSQHRMAKHSNSSWHSHQYPVPTFSLHSTATPKQSRLFIYNLLRKSPVLHCDK